MVDVAIVGVATAVHYTYIYICYICEFSLICWPS